MIPVSIITGFLGSGKTTLLRHLLRDPAMGRTAVIMNEFGEVGIDHDLIETSDESIVRLTTGCLCCKVGSDLVLTLADLAWRRAQGEIPAFERVVIETSGLADPAPILHALMDDAVLGQGYALCTLVTTVDAVNGLPTLVRHALSVRQAAMADRIVITKTDMPQADDAGLRLKLHGLNPGAAVLAAVHGALPPDVLLPDILFGGELPDPGARPAQVQAWQQAQQAAHLNDAAVHVHGAAAHEHDEDIASFCLVREAPVRAAALALFLEALADNCGADLLRVKGIVHVAERPDAPAVIHGVQHIFHAPQWLDRWPSDNHATRIVFITRQIPRTWIQGLLELLDAEVAAESARQGLL